MGQYFYLVNLDKKQFVHAHEIGNGLKIGEQTGWKYSTEEAAKLLVADRSEKHPLIGEWKGDRIGFAGDYGGAFAVAGVPLDGELAGDNAEAVYHACQNDEEGEVGKWTNISASVREMMSTVFGIRYEGDGWMDVKEADGTKVRPGMTPDMIFSVK
jgi:hypothetical protein